MVGLVVGLVRFIWEFSYGPAPPCGDIDTRSPIITKVHYLHFGIILFVIVMAVTTIISLLTKPIDKKHVRSPQQCALNYIIHYKIYPSFLATPKTMCLTLSCRTQTNIGQLLPASAPNIETYQNLEQES